VIDLGREVAEGTPSELKALIGDSTLRLELADPVHAEVAVELAAAVTTQTPTRTPAGSGLTVSLRDANQAADVLIALRRERIDIASATIEQPSLDEVFMAITGHDTGAGSTGQGSAV
jgi:ABC-2 type transport system ATP-binding protein